MAETHVELTLEELARRLMDGERDFSSTRLAPGSDLGSTDRYAELLDYLRGQDLRATPVIGERADWRGIRAPSLYLQSARLAGAELTGADLRGADLRRSDLTGATLAGADLSEATLIGSRLMNAVLQEAVMRETDVYEANLTNSVLRGADLSRAFLLRLSLRGADLTDATLSGADLYRADLRGAIGLGRARDLGTARFHQTVVTPAERELIEATIRSRRLFDVRDE
ncbi:MAG: hypothetical protein GEU73_04825 [Chloroflexi bacterium]|nr:hypothetical protein [Chloroflexota bacterium]